MSPHDLDDPQEVQVLQATPEMCHYCFDVIVKELVRTVNSESSQPGQPPFAQSLPSVEAKCPLFVTWDIKRHSDFVLRGCIGTLSPLPLITAIGEYALTSAFRDHRFDPIDKHEIPHLRVAVSLLVNYEDCSHCHDWTVGVHGIIIKFTLNRSNHYSATYLPEVASEQGWSQEQAVASLVRKAGYNGNVGEDLLSNITCTRYQSSKHRLTYEEYVTLSGSDPFDNASSPKRNWRPWHQS
eukprot:scaffold83948_cov63-Attheya_sp.AAC.4